MARCNLCSLSSPHVSKELGVCLFIASVSPEIPYSLLAFYSHFFISDLPLLSRSTVENCLQAAREEGVRNVRLGNMHLLR